MRVLITFKGAGMDDETLDFSVGDGTQSFKWLAMAVQARMKQEKLTRRRNGSDDVLVVGILNDKGDLLDPTDKIFEHTISPEGLSVTVELVSSLTNDEHGDPEVSDWYATAYIKSTNGSKWHNELTAWRDRLGKIREDNRALDLPSHSLLHIGEFRAADAVKAFELDWGKINWDKLGFAKADPQKKTIHDFLRANYSIICNFFQHFVNVGHVGERYGLSIAEFGHILHYLRVNNYRVSKDRVVDIFYAVLVGEAPLMSRSNLVEGLIRFCKLEYPEKVVSDELSTIVLGSMADYWRQLSSSYLAYLSDNDTLHQAMIQYYHPIKEAFGLWVDATSKFGPSLKLSDFSEMLTTSGLIDATNDQICLNAFLECQLNPTLSWELDEIVFAEFFEALARVALRVIDTAGFSDAQKVRQVFDLISELQHQSHK